MRALTIGELERESGVRRRTIYYYVHHGLLPEAQKSSPSRALYTEDHLTLLRDIATLRGEGLRLAEVRARLAAQVEAAGEAEVDLVARRDREQREAILAAATRSFATRGYKGTRVADLVAELGITPQVLYQHFTSKRHLFVACYAVAVRYMAGVVLPLVREDDDPGVRLVWYMYGDAGIKAFAPDLVALAMEAAQHDEDIRADMREAFQTMLGDLIADLGRMRPSPGLPPLSDELLSQGLFGAFQQMLARSALDGQYTWREAVRTTLGLFLAVAAAYAGEIDLGERLSQYDALLDQVSQLPPPVPPELA